MTAQSWLLKLSTLEALNASQISQRDDLKNRVCASFRHHLTCFVGNSGSALQTVTTLVCELKYHMETMSQSVAITPKRPAHFIINEKDLVTGPVWSHAIGIEYSNEH